MFSVLTGQSENYIVPLRTISFSTFLSLSRAIIEPSRTFLDLPMGLQIWGKWIKGVSISHVKFTAFSLKTVSALTVNM